MDQKNLPLTRDLVLIGGGHTHALVLRRWAMNPLTGARLTLVNPEPTAAYSGMLPGHVAGHYDRDTLDIDLVRLARFAGARLILGSACGIDRETKTVQVKGRPDIGFDIASIDVGINSAMPDLPGFAAHAVPAKPLGPFASAWAAFRTGQGTARLAVIGGGVAGAELAMAMAHAMRKDGRAASITLLEKQRAFSALGKTAADRLKRALQENAIELLEGVQPARISADRVELEDGRHVPADFVTGAAGARPHPWLEDTGLTDEHGFIPVDARLRSSDPAIFATGDCAIMKESPRPKAGVFAVRQAPVLFDNLRAALSETGGLRSYRPQRDYLKLISLGRKAALAERFGMALSGPWLWRWKDGIDRRFMAKFERLEPADPTPLPWPRAAGADAQGQKPMCGGCGAKIGPSALRKALARVETTGIGDDAALLKMGETRQVISTDHLRAMVEDPVTMARIAAVHALGDIWAMGAEPQAALASIVLPRQSPRLAERALAEIIQAAQETVVAAGAEIVGGHSTQGDELIIGFTVTGICHRDPITLSGARTGQKLVLTKPLGSGVIMAAEMEGLARGADVAAALATMSQPQGSAAGILAGASAMTDVTGFGLAGHLAALCDASGVGAELWTDAVPIMPGALSLSKRGVRSSLYAENRQGFPEIQEGPETALFFDPQTGGGLLAAIDGDATALVSEMKSMGFDAAVIGHTTDHAGQVEIV
ncbi:selenide, water dikinase SelD [Marimonas arenosa]|uniref:Selenide, water dikinase SelD n=1 Tax=Marimonas arenosa TaxID=1795305 RepID=A0AAE4B6X0_9RHOB|nr:selenide, water dikinase SelD [Marimonas arenosa]MDQ2091789.1 selenide, water dikinase SelD [Marimonas arenosa]